MPKQTAPSIPLAAEILSRTPPEVIEILLRLFAMKHYGRLEYLFHPGFADTFAEVNQIRG